MILLVVLRCHTVGDHDVRTATISSSKQLRRASGISSPRQATASTGSLPFQDVSLSNLHVGPGLFDCTLVGKVYCPSFMSVLIISISRFFLDKIRNTYQSYLSPLQIFSHGVMLVGRNPRANVISEHFSRTRRIYLHVARLRAEQQRGDSRQPPTPHFCAFKHSRSRRLLLFFSRRRRRGNEIETPVKFEIHRYLQGTASGRAQHHGRRENVGIP